MTCNFLCSRTVSILLLWSWKPCVYYWPLLFSLFFILGGGRSENWEENLHRCSRSSLHNLRPWQFAQIHMPQYVVILIYMKISGRRAHVSFITWVEGDFHCITEQGCLGSSSGQNHPFMNDTCKRHKRQLTNKKNYRGKKKSLKNKVCFPYVSLTVVGLIP